MAKQVKPPEGLTGGRYAGDRASDRSQGAETNLLVAPQAEVPQIEGNAAFGARVGRDEAPSETSSANDLVRETAFPVVDRALLALQIFPRGGDQVRRLCEILEASRLPDERKSSMRDRIYADEASAQAIAVSMQRWFGADNEATRGQLVEGLGQVWTELLTGAEASSGIAASARPGSLSEQAEGMIHDLALRWVEPSLSSVVDAGSAVRSFCRDVQVVLLWDEEEEEEKWDGAEDTTSAE